VADDEASDEVRAMHVPQTDIGRYLLHQLNRISDVERPLIVLDDIHHVFDVPWFDDFFRLLLFSLPQDGHVIMLCRSRPPGPLWRLRSKQMLNVLDEKVIAFSDAEARKLFEAKGVSTRLVGEAQRHAFGRISKLLAFTDAVTG
jgi:ATP/maltotriose-dependent transcriptional regulator MalT